MAEEAIIAKWDSSSESSLQMLSKVILAASVTVFDCYKCKQNAPLVTRLIMAVFSNGQNCSLSQVSFSDCALPWQECSLHLVLCLGDV